MPKKILTLLSAPSMKAFYASGAWRHETIYEMVRRRASAAPDRVAIRESKRQINYAELIAAADRLAFDLVLNGLDAGDRVAVWMPSRIEVAVTLLACSRSG